MMTKTLKKSNGEYKLAHFNLHSPIKIYQKIYETMISILDKMGENTVEILHIYVTRAIYILFYDDQDTESELCEIQTSTSKRILTHKYINFFIGEFFPFSTKREKILW